MYSQEIIKLQIDIPAIKNITYPIFIGPHILKIAGNVAKEFTPSKKILLVSNDTVFPIYGNRVIESFKAANFDIKTIVIPDGEDYKNIEWLKVILDNAIDFKLERKDCIAALGGGVIGDMAGFAASSCLRGVNLIQIGTTLLSHVDSSIGGKVGINHIKGKNLIGAFYQPKCVIIDTVTLETLDKRNVKNGLAEVLKYAFIEKSCNYKGEQLNFFQFLDNNIENIYSLKAEVIKKMISHSCKLKAAVVEQDEKESGLRAILNLGHTTGHALELCGFFHLLNHGEGVSIGIITALRLAKAMNLLDEKSALKGEELFKKFKLPVKIPDSINIKDILESMKLDKKVKHGKLRFILPVNTLGEVSIFDNVEEKLLIQVLESLY